MPALQNEDDISAVVLELRKRDYSGQRRPRGSAQGRLCDTVVCAVTRRPLKAAAKTEHKTCVWGDVRAHSRQCPRPSPWPHGTPVSASSPALLIMPERTKRQLRWGQGARRAGSAGETGNRDWPPLLSPFKNRGFVLSLRRIMSLSPGTH